MDGVHRAGRQGIRAHPVRVNRYPHPATPVPHFVSVPVPDTRWMRWRRSAAAWLGRAWPVHDLVLWTCVVAMAGLDILITVAGIEAGVAAEGNRIGATAYAVAGPLGLLQLKLVALVAILALWVALPWRWRPYVRAGTLAGGTLTSMAVAHNVLLLM